jgi:hypothetical protein
MENQTGQGLAFPDVNRVWHQHHAHNNHFYFAAARTHNALVRGQLLMKLCKTQVFVFLFVLATVPVHGQRGTLGFDVGGTSDQFGSLPSVGGSVFGLDGQAIILPGSVKEDIPNIVVGGEIILPEKTSSHATEFALFGGPEFLFPHHFTAGFHFQLRKLYMPSGTLNGVLFGRDNMWLLELPIVIGYKFGPGNHAFVQAQGVSEFKPRFSNKVSANAFYPPPNLDHGYMMRGVAGYDFGKWYLKATYSTRYLKFEQDASRNPGNLYNWRNQSATIGFGLAF